MSYTIEDITEIFNKILIEIESGRALRKILKEDDNMPSTQTFYKWIDEDAEKSKQYARACEVRADAIFDDIIDIADDSSRDKKVIQSGEVIDSEFVARSRIRIDARKWIASKLNPKKYGDKIDHTTDGEKIQSTVIVNLGSGLNPDEVTD
jgi:hypothetical protein